MKYKFKKRQVTHARTHTCTHIHTHARIHTQTNTYTYNTHTHTNTFITVIFFPFILYILEHNTASVQVVGQNLACICRAYFLQQMPLTHMYKV